MAKLKYKFENITESNYREWDRFLVAQKYQNPFQSGKLLMALNKCDLYKPSGTLVRDKKTNRILGGGIVYTITEKQGYAKFLSVRSVINGGPIVTSPELFSLVTDKLVAASKKAGAIYCEIWNMRDMKDLIASHNLKYDYVGHLNYFIDLTVEEEKLFSSLSSGLRRGIKKNTKKFQIKEVENKAEFDEFYACLKETYSRRKLPLMSSRVFEEVWKSNYGLFLIAKYGDEIAASRVVLCFGGEIYDWYAGDRRKFSALGANAILVWHIIQYGIRNNYKWFNFGGAGKPGKAYGPREFKRRFNGELVNYGRFLFINSRFRYRLLKLAVKILDIIS